MKKLPEVNIDYAGLYTMLIDPIRSALLLTGIELKVFNQLSEPKSADAVAKAIGTHPKNTRAFLDGLASIDLLEKKNGLYRNSPLAQVFLVEDSPTFLGRLLSFMKPDVQMLETLPQAGKGRPAPSARKASIL